MNYRLVGVNHRTAPVEVRERLAIPEAETTAVLERLTAWPGVSEALVLSTCNRVELLVDCKHDADARPLREFLAGYLHLHLDAREFDSCFYEHRGADAVRHLFRVASSLDSMIVGEPQILGQVKEAYAIARGAGAVRSELDVLITRAFAVAKRVRSETQIASSAVSIASVAVELALKIFGSLQGRQVCLVGAGKMGELAARHLVAQGAEKVLVANRTPERARQLAARFGGQAVAFDKLHEAAARMDIVITTTGSPQPIFRREHGEAYLRERRNRPMFFIDIAVPRDVAAEMNELDGIFVYDIDDLQQVVATHVAGRRREAERAEQIISEEVRRFTERVQTLDVVPTIVSLQEQVETIRQAEIDKVRGRLGALSPEQELAIEAMTRGIVNKLLHAPIVALKSAARGEHGPKTTNIVEVVRRIFNLNLNLNLDLSQDDSSKDAARTAAAATTDQAAGEVSTSQGDAPRRDDTKVSVDR